MARIAIWVIIRRHVWEEGYDPDVGCRLTREAEGRLDETADPHNGNVEADSVGRWGNSIKLPCPLHGHQEPRYITPRGMGPVGHDRGKV